MKRALSWQSSRIKYSADRGMYLTARNSPLVRKNVSTVSRIKDYISYHVRISIVHINSCLGMLFRTSKAQEQL